MTHLVVPPIVAVVGLVVYVLAEKAPRAQAPALYAWACGLLATLLQLAAWR